MIIEPRQKINMERLKLLMSEPEVEAETEGKKQNALILLILRPPLPPYCQQEVSWWAVAALLGPL